jgi:hypothetical protein
MEGTHSAFKWLVHGFGTGPQAAGNYPRFCVRKWAWGRIPGNSGGSSKAAPCNSMNLLGGIYVRPQDRWWIPFLV